MSTSSRILLVGSGGVGGVVAALLSRAGVELTVVTGNPQIRDAIGAHGLRIRELSGDEWTARPTPEPVVRLADLPPGATYDLCLLATKSTNLDQVLLDVAPRLAAGGSLVCMQNGLPEERAVAVLGPQRVIGCIVSWGATLLAPGHLARTSEGGFTIGRAADSSQGAPDSTLAAVAALLGRVLPTRTIDNLAGARWSKLAINCATSTLGAAGGDTLGRLLRQRLVRRLTLELWAELCAVADAAGVKMAPVLGRLDIRALALTEAERRRKLGSLGLVAKHALLWAIAFRYRRMRSSMAVAIERGRTPEIDHLNGEIVRRGATLGIDTPLNAALVTLIHDIVARQRQPGLQTLHELYQAYERRL